SASSETPSRLARAVPGSPLAPGAVRWGRGRRWARRGRSTPDHSATLGRGRFAAACLWKNRADVCRHGPRARPAPARRELAPATEGGTFRTTAHENEEAPGPSAIHGSESAPEETRPFDALRYPLPHGRAPLPRLRWVQPGRATS